MLWLPFMLLHFGRLFVFIFFYFLIDCCSFIFHSYNVSQYTYTQVLCGIDWYVFSHIRTHTGEWLCIFFRFLINF